MAALTVEKLKKILASLPPKKEVRLHDTDGAVYQIDKIYLEIFDNDYEQTPLDIVVFEFSNC